MHKIKIFIFGTFIPNRSKLVGELPLSENVEAPLFNYSELSVASRSFGNLDTLETDNLLADILQLEARNQSFPFMYNFSIRERM